MSPKRPGALYLIEGLTKVRRLNKNIGSTLEYIHRDFQTKATGGCPWNLREEKGPIACGVRMRLWMRYELKHFVTCFVFKVTQEK